MIEFGHQDDGGGCALHAAHFAEFLQHLVQPHGGLRADDHDKIECAADRLAGFRLRNLAQRLDHFGCMFGVHRKAHDGAQPVAGDVEAVAEGVSGIAVGDRVLLSPSTPAGIFGEVLLEP